VIRTTRRHRLLPAGILAALLAAPGGVAAEERTIVSDPFQIDLALDGAVLGGALVLWITPSLANRGLPGPGCDPCDPEGLNALDRGVIDNHSPAADTTGDVLAVALPAAAGLAGLLHLEEAGWRGVGTDALLILQSMATCGVVNQIVRHAVRRPRPFMYTPGARDAATRGDVEASLSFYSGHAATVFAAAAALTTITFARRPRGWMRWLVLGGSLLAASAVPVARVLSGEHFPTDVLVGAATGAAFGYAIPALHRRSGGAGGRRGEGAVTFTPQVVHLSPLAGAPPGLGIGGHF
jgi:membrane-associated phospholipid phosphatase